MATFVLLMVAGINLMLGNVVVALVCLACAFAAMLLEEVTAS